MERDDSNFEIVDVENYRSQGDQVFSHEILVMRSINKCIEAGAKEMRGGYYNEKLDKFGNRILIYNPDTRKEFIQSVITTKTIMSCDLDTDKCKKVKENIKLIEEKLKKEYKELCEIEREDWANSKPLLRKSRWTQGITFRDGSLNKKMPYYQEYIEFAVDCYVQIFEELIRATKLMDFYQGTDVGLGIGNVKTN